MNQREPKDRETIRIVDAADRVGVSIATIRNWVKLGYIEQQGRGQLWVDSLERYERDAVGSSKLTRRANKQHKSEEVGHALDLSLWREYEGGLTEAHRNREGIYYTPEAVVDDMLRGATRGVDLSEKSFLDPACGSGNFIIKAIELGFDPRNVYGYDTDEAAVAITRHRIKELTGYDSANIVSGDFLECADSLVLRFDYIFTNPPWGKKYYRRDGERLARRYSSGGSRDSSSLFVMASLMVLRQGGVMGFLLQQAFFNITSYADIRERLLRMRIDRMVDYGRSFRRLITRAQAIVVTNEECCDGWMIECGDGRLRSQQSFAKMPRRIFNFVVSESAAELIVALLSRDHTSLRDNAKWGMGIVTGDNRRYCRREPQMGDVEIYRGSDITREGLRSASHYISDDLSLYQQSAPRHIYDAPCKLIYRFISSCLCFYCDKDQRLVLNSANCMIPSEELGISPENLILFLNCDFMSWLFSSIFMTHKILRRDLELLPIFVDYFDHYSSFEESTYLAYIGVLRSDDGYKLITN